MVSTVLVIGAGAFGMSTALELNARGYQVHVLDRASKLPALDAASTDINKIIRFDYGNQRYYMTLAHEAMKHWRAWNQEYPDDPYFVECGLIVLTEGQMEDGSFEADSWREIQNMGLAPLKRLKGVSSIESRFPAYTGKTMFKDGYFNPSAGYADSGLTMERLYRKCLAAGVQFTLGQDGEFKEFLRNEKGEASAVVTKSGKIHTGDTFILATGSWTSAFVPETALEAHGQAVIHIKVPAHLREKYSSKNFPVFAYDIAKTGFYGFPVHAKTGLMKIARHASGYSRNVSIGSGIERSVPLTAVDDPNQTIPVIAYQELKSFVQKFFPDLADQPFYSSRICWYSDSVDGDFVIDFLPSCKNVLVASGGSGHAFKFTPILGQLVADRLEHQRDRNLLDIFKWRSPDKSASTAERAIDEVRSLTESAMTDSSLFSKNESKI